MVKILLAHRADLYTKDKVYFVTDILSMQEISMTVVVEIMLFTSIQHLCMICVSIVVWKNSTRKR